MGRESQSWNWLPPLGAKLPVGMWVSLLGTLLYDIMASGRGRPQGDRF